MAMQFPGMTPLTYAAAPNYAQAAQGLGTALQKIAPKPAIPTAPTPMNISPAATNAGTNVPQPGLMDALKGMSPQSILDRLRAMSAGGQSVIPPGMPGSAALDGAGMLTPGRPLGVPDTGNRGVADLVSPEQAAQQAREAAAYRLSQAPLNRSGYATMNNPQIPLLPYRD